MVKTHRFFQGALPYLMILVIGLGMLLMVRMKYTEDIDRARDHYSIESHEQAKNVAYDVDRVFRSMYQGLRTIALLPGVRGIDRYGRNLNGDARQTTQELYNNLASNVAMSEVYIVPVDMQPDQKDPHTRKLQEPITTFDQLIVGRHADQGKVKAEGEESESEVEEIEIYEYRLMRQQLDWFQKHYPQESRIEGLDYPAMCGPEVITCDNTRFSPQHPNDKDRSGLVYSVPFYSPEGKLKGCISGIILTHTLRDLLPTGDYALSSPVRSFLAPSHVPGSVDQYVQAAAAARPVQALLYSEAVPLKIRDAFGNWSLWAGQPNSAFWSRNDVQSAHRFAMIGYGASGLLILSLCILTALTGHHRKAMLAKNQELEIRVQERTAELQRANDRLQSLATTDGMTGLANHRTFQERLQQAAGSIHTRGGELALLLIDVDKFKQYNDTFGHPAGDEVLRTLARLLTESVREEDCVARCIARYGGEEFAILLPDVSQDNARAIAERVRLNVAEHAFPNRKVTLSIGVALYSTDQEDVADLVSEADRALYTAKHSGRNQVVVAADLEVPAEASASPHLALIASVPTNIQNVHTLLTEPAGQIAIGLLLALDMRDAETEGHCERVVWYSLRIAEEFPRIGMSPLTSEEWRELTLGALLHDIGKMKIPDSILFKPTSLTPEEWEIMRQHPEMGVAQLDRFPELAKARQVVRSHHERWDGAGYPDGLISDAIPLTARIFAIADSLDAMTSDRPYRPAMSYQMACSEIVRGAARQFDPAIVHAFLNIPEEDWTRLRSTHTILTPQSLPVSLPLNKAA